MRKDYEQPFCRVRPLQRASEVSPQSRWNSGCSYLAGRAFFPLRTGCSQAHQASGTLAFKVFGLDVADMYHMLFSAGFAGLVLLGHCPGPGASGHACAFLSGRNRRGKRQVD